MSTSTKMIIVLGVVISLTFIAAFGGMLVMAQQSGETAQEAFFQAVASGQPEQVLEQCHPALRQEIDMPVLATWMQAINKHLGEYRSLSAKNFTTSTRIENGTYVFKSEGEVLFERGTAQSELIFTGGSLTRFQIDTKALPAGWFTGPAESDLYQTRSRVFLNTFLQGRGKKTRELMHEVLQGMASNKTLKDQLAWVKGYSGEIQNIKYLSEDIQIKGNDQRLTVTFLAEGTEANMEATVSFQFAGLKGHLVAYRWKPTDRP